MTRPLKVIWLCTYTNEDKRRRLHLWRRHEHESGNWIPNLLEGICNDPLFKVHVVSTDSCLVAPIQHWEEKNVAYHCFKSGVPLYGRGWPSWLPVEHATYFWINRHRIRRIVDAIKPDLIHLFGAENPQYGAAALDLTDKYPLLITIQGFIHRELAYHEDFYTRVRCRYEEKLLRQCRDFTGDYESEQVVRRFRPDARYRHTYFPVNEKLIGQLTANSEKKYDLLFAGGLTPQKGFSDYLEIVRALVGKGANVRAAVVGSIDAYPPAKSFIEKHHLADNVIWLPRFTSQQGLFEAFQQAKLFLSPTYNDCFASTIRENMMIGTPVIAYATGGIPWANRDGGKNVVLVTQGDVEGMTNAVFHLLQNERERMEMADRAKSFATQEFALYPNMDVIKKAYVEIVGNP